jgi:heme exporter protein C
MATAVIGFVLLKIRNIVSSSTGIVFCSSMNPIHSLSTDLLFLYIAYLSLYSAIEDQRKASKAASLLAIIGVVNVPIIYFSVKWWNTLHQGASITVTKTSMQSTMLMAMLIMTFAFWAYAFAVILSRVNQKTLDEESHTDWALTELKRLKATI